MTMIALIDFIVLPVMREMPIAIGLICSTGCLAKQQEQRVSALIASKHFQGINSGQHLLGHEAKSTIAHNTAREELFSAMVMWPRCADVIPFKE